MFKTATSIIFVLAFLFCGSLTTNVFSDKNSILLTLENATFVPLSNVHGNQVTMSVKYQVIDESLEGEKVNGIMKIYATNGSLIHSSSFPNGFTAKKKGGTEDFKTTIRDPTTESLRANLTFTDIKKSETISNSITTNLQLKKLPAPVATSVSNDSTND